MKSFSYFDTQMGRGGVGATDFGICKVWLPGDPLLPTIGNHTSSLSESAAQLLRSYFFTGEEQPFQRLLLDLSTLTDFRQRVLALVRTIRYGTVTSYGEIACMVGNCKGTRAIGGALASNPLPVIIPCHRVVASNGVLTGFTAPGGIGTKKVLLEMEGVAFSGDKIAIKSAGFAQVLVE